MQTPKGGKVLKLLCEPVDCLKKKDLGYKDLRYFKHSQKAEAPDTGRSVTATPKSAYDEIISQ